MGDIWNIIFAIVFAAISVYLIYAYIKIRKLIMIPDQSFSWLRMSFFLLGILSMLSFVNAQNTYLDYARFIATITCVTMLLVVHNGLGEDGIVAGLHFYQWSELRGWDYLENKNNTDFFFQVESTNKKKKDEYTTKTVTFGKDNVDVAMKFLRLNARNKYMRMKKNAR